MSLAGLIEWFSDGGWVAFIILGLAAPCLLGLIALPLVVSKLSPTTLRRLAMASVGGATLFAVLGIAGYYFNIYISLMVGRTYQLMDDPLYHQIMLREARVPLILGLSMTVIMFATAWLLHRQRACTQRSG